MAIVLLLSFLLVPQIQALGIFGSPPLLETCYPAVGCFTNLRPYTSPTRAVPPPQNPINISNSMAFFSQEAQNGVQFTIYPKINVADVVFDGNKSTYIIFHDYASTPKEAWIKSVMENLLKSADGNVLVTEYGQDVPSSYEQTAGDIRVLGKLVSMVVTSLNVDPAKLHLIGHGLGGQAASFAAKYLQEDGKKAARLTALDPTGHLFEDEDLLVRLSPDDAELVDVMHTDICMTGMANPAGHVDFYMNKGRHQPGCEPTHSEVSDACSHNIAYEFFIDALESECMFGRPTRLELNQRGHVQVINVTASDECTSDQCVPIGLGTEKYAARGVFQVLTNPSRPYCITA